MHSRLGYVLAVFVGSFGVYCAQDLVRDDNQGDGPVSDAEADLTGDPLFDPASDSAAQDGLHDSPVDGVPGDLAQADAGDGGDGPTCERCPRQVLFDEVLTLEGGGLREGPIVDLSTVSRAVVHVSGEACAGVSVNYRHGVAGFQPAESVRLDGRTSNCEAGMILGLDPTLGSEVRLDIGVSGFSVTEYPIALTVVGFP